MKIRLESEGHSLHLWLPNGVIVNKLTSNLLFRRLEKWGICIPKEQRKTLLKAVRSSKSQLKGWKLLEAESADGDLVEITL